MIEHELIVRKLTMEIEVLHKKSAYLDMKMKSAGRKGQSLNNLMPTTPSSHFDYASCFQPRDLFNTPSATLIQQSGSSVLTGFNYTSEAGDATNVL